MSKENFNKNIEKDFEEMESLKSCDNDYISFV